MTWRSASAFASAGLAATLALMMLAIVLSAPSAVAQQPTEVVTLRVEGMT